MGRLGWGKGGTECVVSGGTEEGLKGLSQGGTETGLNGSSPGGTEGS